MRLKALKAAFPSTLPIFTGFWFLGMAYGIYRKADATLYRGRNDLIYAAYPYDMI